MEKENTQSDIYSADNLIRYRMAIALADSMENSGCFNASDKKKIYAIIAEKYGLNSCSIFAA